jgi:WXG100 family type VII secretion target
MPALFADPAQLRAIAERIARHAAAARAQAGRIGMQLAHPGWAGAAARAFHGQARALVHDLRRAAQRLDDAADALRRHAANVEHALAGLAKLAADGIDLGLDVAHTIGDLVTNPGNVLNDGRELVRDVAGLGPQVKVSRVLGLDG